MKNQNIIYNGGISIDNKGIFKKIVENNDEIKGPDSWEKHNRRKAITIGAYARSNKEDFCYFSLKIDGRIDSIPVFGNESWCWMEHTIPENYSIFKNFSISFDVKERHKFSIITNDFSGFPGGGSQEKMRLESLESDAWAEICEVLIHQENK